MKKKILFSLKSPYREQLDIIGFRFGHGKKSLAIVGAMRGNEVQQMYVCYNNYQNRTIKSGAAAMMIQATAPYYGGYVWSH